MTDDDDNNNNWDFYFTQVEGKAASMYVDLGLHKRAPDRKLPFVAYVSLDMKAPRDDGLSSQQEFDILIAIEDMLRASLEDKGTRYVGRCTINGCRDFLFYVAQPDDWGTRVAACMRKFSDYAFVTKVQEDAAWSLYLWFLYPDEADLQVIQNRRVCDALERNGDKLIAAREIDHWAYFPDAGSRDAYVADARKLGFAVRAVTCEEGDGGRYCARVWRWDVPSFDVIDEVTLPLFELAIAHSGSYDGWESPVVSHA